MHNSMQRREAGCGWCEVGGEPASGGLGTAVLAMGGGESARAKGGTWKRLEYVLSMCRKR